MMKDVNPKKKLVLPHNYFHFMIIIIIFTIRKNKYFFLQFSISVNISYQVVDKVTPNSAKDKINKKQKKLKKSLIYAS